MKCSSLNLISNLIFHFQKLPPKPASLAPNISQAPTFLQRPSSRSRRCAPSAGAQRLGSNPCPRLRTKERDDDGAPLSVVVSDSMDVEGACGVLRCEDLTKGLLTPRPLAYTTTYGTGCISGMISGANVQSQRVYPAENYRWTRKNHWCSAGGSKCLLRRWGGGCQEGPVIPSEEARLEP